MPVASQRSGYVQTVRPGRLLAQAAGHGVCLRLRPRVGEHVVAGTTLAWIWRGSPRDPAPDPRAFVPVLDAGVRIGFERTLEQDAALGIRQLVDVACKALSPAVNDPYTAVQAVDHLSVIFCALAQRPLGNHVVRGGSGAAVIVPGRRFPDYLAVMCGLIRRYGAREPTVAHAMLRLLGNCAAVAGDDPRVARGDRRTGAHRRRRRGARGGPAGRPRPRARRGRSGAPGRDREPARVRLAGRRAGRPADPVTTERTTAGNDADPAASKIGSEAEGKRASGHQPPRGESAG